MLDIKLPTLYAYVSRGWVRSMPGVRGRARRYARSDIDRLRARRDARRGHQAVAAGALRWGEPVLDSSITEITPAGHRYRGHSAVELSRSHGFEQVAELLWTGTLGEDRGWPERPDRTSVRKLRSLVAPDASSISVLAALVTIMAARDLDRLAVASGSSTSPPELSRARRILCTAACALAPDARPSGSIAHMLDAALSTRAPASSSRARDRRARAINQALILIADHELNISAFAARVTASGGADLYACVSAGLAALSGPRHGGMCDRLEALARACDRPDRAARLIRDRLQRGESIPGFGHPLYPTGDARARAVLDTARRIGGKRRETAIMDALARAMYRAGRQRPAVDFALVTLARALRLRPGAASALFAMGRIAGFIAHIFEQRQAGFLLRPRARYVGPSTTTEEALT